MSFDLEIVTAGWVTKSDRQRARLVRTADGRQVLQFYEALSVVQMELEGRPDGLRPGGFDSMLAALDHRFNGGGAGAVRVTPQEWMELDREFAQYQQRRKAALIAAASAIDNQQMPSATLLLQVAVGDAGHCLAILDLAGREHPSGRLPADRGELRPSLCAQQAFIEAQLATLSGDHEIAIEILKAAIERISNMLAGRGDASPAASPCIRELETAEHSLRVKHGIRLTLAEQLDEAVRTEDYERAAVLRDRIAERKQGVNSTMVTGPSAKVPCR